MTAGQPTLARRSLGIAVRKLREAKGLRRKQAAEAIGYSEQTIQRIEEGTQKTKHVTIKALCEALDAPPGEMGRLCGLAADGSKRGWWQGYTDGVQPHLPLFLETEQEAAELQVIETEFIPGLLQAPEYLIAVQDAYLPMPHEAAQALRKLRARRQELVYGREDPPRMWFVIGRAAMEYLEDLPEEVKRGQTERILEVAAMPTVEIRVITKLHAAMLGSFNILTPGPKTADHPPFVYIDAVDGCRYVEDPTTVSLYERTFQAVWDRAIPIEEYLK